MIRAALAAIVPGLAAMTAAGAGAGPKPHVPGFSALNDWEPDDRLAALQAFTETCDLTDDAEWAGRVRDGGRMVVLLPIRRAFAMPDAG